MTGGEIPFAGHPSLGVAAAVARARGEASVTYTQETRAGLQPIDVEVADGVTHASMLQEPAEFGPELDPGRGARRASASSAEDAHPELPCQAVSTGLAHVLAPVRDAARAGPRVARPRPHRRAARAARRDRACTSSRVDPEAGTARARSFFARRGAGRGSRRPARPPARSAPTSPQRTGALALTIDARAWRWAAPSRLARRLEGDRVRVGGDAVVVLDGTVFLDT